jgi:hypothetical protein
VIVAGFAFRYEPDWMVDQLKENLAWVDGFAVFDGRQAIEPWEKRTGRNEAIWSTAREMGATWILHTAPDERWEPDAATKIADALASHPRGRFAFPLREMWTPTAYRSDGAWGKKYRVRVSRLDDPGRATFYVDSNIYHLKMIEPENRAERQRVHTAYNTWDNRSKGFAYMTDERGLRLTEVPPDRLYTPGYRPYRFSVPE